MLKQKLADLLKEAARRAQDSGKLPQFALPDISVEHPENPAHGDYASSLPLKLARAIGLPPVAIARELASFIPATEEIETVSVAPPGFVNFKLKQEWLAGRIDAILAAGSSYGNIQKGGGSRVQLEFVSVNPTGPLHVGHGRGAVLGSTLANVLRAAGYSIETEYYINDAGNQMQAFYRYLFARYRQALGVPAEMPTEGYHGAYMVELAKEIAAAEGDRFLKLPEPEGIAQLGQAGLYKVLDMIKADLDLLGVSFDVWFSEQSLYRNSQYRRSMDMLRAGGHLAEKAGATWFVSTALGEDKDNVVVRGDGSPTYFAADIAYHYNKFLERHFDTVINIWGADHQGHVSRMKAVVGALGINPDRLKVIISQLVTLCRGGEIVRLSKRTGDIITLRELLDDVGKDACRFFFLSRSADAQMEFDIELAKKESADNPVYYIQYAHARIASIFRLAQERGIRFEDGDVSRLTGEAELTLIRKLALLPEVIETVTDTLEPHHLTYYAQDLATVFHKFYMVCRVITEDEPTTKARLKLVAATQVVLGKTLNLMGMTAPERM